MTEAVSLYTPIAEELPHIYRTGDRESWRQVQVYLSLVDGVCRHYLNQLVELPAVLSPAARFLTPPGEDESSSLTDIQCRRNQLLDKVANWFGCVFPDYIDWRVDAALSTDHNNEVIRRKSDFLRRCPSLWRRRGTPTGFLAL